MDEKVKPQFTIGDKVVLSNTNKSGVVISILSNDQILVFFSQKEQVICAANDLEPIESKIDFIEPLKFLTDLLIFKLQKPLSNVLYSYSMSKTNREPYQFKPAIKLLKNPKNRILIADEVGLGKTIEACIIYLEMKARMQGDIPRVMVVCPAGLKEKWQSEFMIRFEEQFDIYDTALMNKFLDNYEKNPSTRVKCICSLEMLRQESLYGRFDEIEPQFDLIIVDEAHHMRNPDTLSFDLGTTLENSTYSLVLMTATPVQLQSLDLYYLLKILDPVQFENPEIFQYQLEPNKLINHTISELNKTDCNYSYTCNTLDSFPQNLRDNPYYLEARDFITKAIADDNDEDKRRHTIMAIRNLHQLNPFSLVFTRTRRKEVMAGAIRVAQVIDIDLSPIEKEIYDAALEFARARCTSNFSLGTIQIERMIASSIGAYRFVLDNMKKDRTYTRIESSSTSMYEPESIPQDHISDLWLKVHQLYSKLGQIDTKFDRFLETVRWILNEHNTSKVIVYSFFKPTLRYLKSRLTNLGIPTELIDGDVPVKNRKFLMERFKENSEIRILLSSEVGSEGLDFQFCNCVINYDLPWNPMRVEQRIGRVDRYGQESNKVTVVSFFLNNTIEDRILRKLYERIRVFEESVGSLEPILGNIEKELAYEIISKNLSKEQERIKTEQYLKMLEFKQKDLEDYENSRYELMGQDTVFNSEIDDNITSGRYISPIEIRCLIQSFIMNKCPKSDLKQSFPNEDCWVLEPDEQLCNKFRSHISRKGGASHRDWDFLNDMQNCISNPKKSMRGIPITFSSSLAIERPALEFVNIWHPLTTLSFQELSDKPISPPNTRMIDFKIENRLTEDKGVYYFFVFWLSIQAIARTDELVTLCLNERGEINKDLSSKFLNIIYDCSIDNSWGTNDSQFDYETFSSLEKVSFDYMYAIRNERELYATQKNDAMIIVRKSALKSTYTSRIQRATLRLQHAQHINNQRLITMFEAQIRNLKNKMAGALDEVEAKKHITVAYEPVCYGVMNLL